RTSFLLWRGSSPSAVSFPSAARCGARSSVRELSRRWKRKRPARTEQRKERMMVRGSTNKQKAALIKQWIDPDERITIQFDDQRDLSAEVTGCTDRLRPLFLARAASLF